MDLKISGVGFQGKKEILYALTKAAQKSKDFEYYSQPAIASRMPTYKLQASQTASISAYLDMALIDSEFRDVVTKATDKDLAEIKQFLAPERTEHSLVEPMKKFSKSMTDTVNNNYGGKTRETMTAFVHDLLQKLKS